MDNKIRLLYDKEADVLYVTSGNPEYTEYEEVGEDFILRRDPKSKKIVGFTIIDFSAHFAEKEPPLAVPVQAIFSRAGNGRKSRVVAERKAIYRTKKSVTR